MAKGCGAMEPYLECHPIIFRTEIFKTQTFKAETFEAEIFKIETCTPAHSRRMKPKDDGLPAAAAPGKARQSAAPSRAYD